MTRTSPAPLVRRRARAWVAVRRKSVEARLLPCLGPSRKNYSPPRRDPSPHFHPYRQPRQPPRVRSPAAVTSHGDLHVDATTNAFARPHTVNLENPHEAPKRGRVNAQSLSRRRQG